MKIKTSELSGVALDWAVAQAAERKLDTHQGKIGYYVDNWYANVNSKFVQWSPSIDWSQGGPLIERFGVTVMKYDDSCLDADRANLWTAKPDGSWADGWIIDSPSALIAACRAIVSAKLGDEIDVPEGLV